MGTACWTTSPRVCSSTNPVCTTCSTADKHRKHQAQQVVKCVAAKDSEELIETHFELLALWRWHSLKLKVLKLVFNSVNPTRSSLNIKYRCQSLLRLKCTSVKLLCTKCHLNNSPLHLWMVEWEWCTRGWQNTLWQNSFLVSFCLYEFCLNQIYALKVQH